MNNLITTHVIYRGNSIPVEQLKENSNLKVVVQCHHGQREVRWNRRYQLCRKCVAELGLYNTSKTGREITWGNKISKAKKGKSFSEDHRMALSKAQYGVDDLNWPGFYHKSEVHKIRDSQEYVEFRKSILIRDNFRCVLTGKQGKLNVHHIEGVNKNLHLIFDPNNAITLHHSVHKLFHDLYGRGNNTSEQFLDFVSRLKEELYNG